MPPKEDNNNDTIMETCCSIDSMTSTSTQSTPTSINDKKKKNNNNNNKKKAVSFNEDVVVYEVTHLNDIDARTKLDVWYSDFYLRTMRCNMIQGNDDDDDDDTSTNDDETLRSFMKARNIRRSRQLVMAEQARQKRCITTNTNNNGNNDNIGFCSDDGRDGETLIRNEYCRVATTSQADATQRGKVMASQALKILTNDNDSPK